jgi:hypothetical protein
MFRDVTRVSIPTRGAGIFEFAGELAGYLTNGGLKIKLKKKHEKFGAG